MPTLDPITVEGSAAPPPEQPIAAIHPEPGQIAVKGPSGQVEMLPEENLGQAMAKGYQPATEAEYFAEQQGAFGKFGAAAVGAARGATFGLADPFYIEGARLLSGDDKAEQVRHSMNLMKDAHPGYSIGGEIAGSLAPMLVGAPPAGAAALGEGLLARAGARAVAAAPRLALEGAGISLGQQLSEDALGNHDAAAQKYLAAGVKGGIIGILLGGGMTAGLGALGDKLALRAEGAAERAVQRGAEGAPFRVAGEVAAETTAGKPLLARASAFAEEQAAKGAMPSASLAGSEMQKLGSTAEAQQERIRRIGRTLLDEGITTPTATKAMQAKRLTARAEEVGEELGALRRSLEKANARPSVESIVKRIEAEVLGPLVERPFSATEQAAVRPILAEIVERAGGKLNAEGGVSFESLTFKSFDDLFKIRKALDGKLKWEKGIPPPTPALKELRAIRGILEDEFESAAERAAAELGDGAASKYRVTKALYADLKTAEKWATKGAARDAQNRAVSLTDTIMAGAAVASGHPMGVLAPIGNKLMRTFGNQTAASIVDRATKIESIQRAAATFDAKLKGSVAAFFGGAPPARKATEAVTPETTRALREAVRNTTALSERAAAAVAATGAAEHAPNVARAMTGAVVRAATYVQSKLPPEPPPVGLSLLPQKPRALSARSQADVERVVRSLDTDAVLDDIAHKRIDRQSMAALEIINPEVFSQVQKEMRDYVAQNSPKMSSQQEVALSIIFKTPLTAQMQPSNIRGFQQTFAESSAPPKGASPRSLSPSKVTRATSTDRLEKGDV